MPFWEKKVVEKTIANNDSEYSNLTTLDNLEDGNNNTEEIDNNNLTSACNSLCNSAANFNETDNPLVSVPLHQARINSIFNEYETVARNPIEGIYITPSAESPLVWFGLLIVRSGIFYGGIFRFTINIPDDYPDTTSLPIVQFEESLFHPLINPKSNCVDLTRFFPSGWQKGRNYIYQVITATQGIFFSCHCDSSQAANPEAAILIKENRHKFIQLAHDAVRRSRTQVYAMPNSDDQNAIRFTPWNEIEMEPIRLFLLGKSDRPKNLENTNKEKTGISWIDYKNQWMYFCKSG